jgi:hypothetical protein
MPIVQPPNLAGDSHGLENSSATDLLCRLKKTLWDDFNAFVIEKEGILTPENTLLASHTVNGQTIPSIWVKNIEDNLPLNKDGVSLVISPAPRTRLNSYAERVNIWSVYAIDYSESGLKLNAMLQIIQGRLFTHTKFVPEQNDSDQFEARGTLYIELTDDLRSKQS